MTILCIATEPRLSAPGSPPNRLISTYCGTNCASTQKSATHVLTRRLKPTKIIFPQSRGEGSGRAIIIDGRRKTAAWTKAGMAMVVSILSLSRLPGVAFDGWEADVITLDTHESLYLARKAENESQLDLQHHRPQPLRPYLHQPRNTTNCFPAFQTAHH